MRDLPVHREGHLPSLFRRRHLANPSCGRRSTRRGLGARAGGPASPWIPQTPPAGQPEQLAHRPGDEFGLAGVGRGIRADQRRDPGGHEIVIIVVRRRVGRAPAAVLEIVARPDRRRKPRRAAASAGRSRAGRAGAPRRGAARSRATSAGRTRGRPVQSRWRNSASIRRGSCRSGCWRCPPLECRPASLRARLDFSSAGGSAAGIGSVFCRPAQYTELIRARSCQPSSSST